MASPSVVQSKEVLSAGFHAVPAVVMNSAPAVGNLMIVFLAGVPFGTPTLANGWTAATDEGTGAFGTNLRCIYRYVVGGDTATLPALENSGITWQNAFVAALEITNVPAIYASALDQVIHNTLASSATPSIVSVNAGFNDELALVFGQQDAGTSTAPTSSAGWTVEQSEAAGSTPAYNVSSEPFATAGAAVALTWTYDQANSGRYAGILLQSGVAPPPDGRLTQAPLLVLCESAVPGRLTQAPLLVLGKVDPPARLTQVPLLALVEYTAVGRLTQAPLLVLGEDVPCLTKWAQCWKITRTDGTVFTFTDHDEVVSFANFDYEPCNSLTASASELGAIIGQIGNLDLNGIISDDAITETDLLGGKFDGCTIEVWMVPWDNQGGEIPFRLSYGVGGNVEQGTTAFRMEVLTPGAKLQQQALLQTYTPQCRFELGDVRCGIHLNHLAVDGQVTGQVAPAAFNQASRRIFQDATRMEADGYFNMGTVTWLTGPNAGAFSEVKSFENGTFVLWQVMIYPVGVNDEYQAVPGCNKLKETCINTFDNFENFGGFPDVTGEDAPKITPDTKSVSVDEVRQRR